MKVYQWARALNHKRKAYLRERQGRWLSPVRRIERVRTDERICAMTFDDGPCALPASPDVGGGVPLTRLLADALLAHGFSATFDVIGDTSENYPDRVGKAGGFYCSGQRYDHYPRFGQDAHGGVRNCPELVRYLLGHGFELSSHGYRHRLFGFNPVYFKRRPMGGAAEAERDARELHELLEREYGVTLALARPPHYVDAMRGGMNAYDLYELMDYQYMAASFDGGGWLPYASYDEAVERMLAPLRGALERDPDALCGQIIFQKDGCDMNGMTPIASALPQQLALLAQYGYRVCSVGELLQRAPFADLPAGDRCFPAARALAQAGVPVAYRFNDVRPDGPLRWGELCMMLAPSSARRAAIRARMDGARRIGRYPARHPYAAALSWADRLGCTRPLGEEVTGESFAALCAAASLPAPPMQADYTRREGIVLCARMLGIYDESL